MGRTDDLLIQVCFVLRYKVRCVEGGALPAGGEAKGAAAHRGGAADAGAQK